MLSLISNGFVPTRDLQRILFEANCYSLRGLGRGENSVSPQNAK